MPLTIEKVRQKLAGQPCQVAVRGNSLYLVATLPDRRGLRPPYQQRIALGVKATELGLEYALGKALEVSAALIQRRFQWEIIHGEKSLQDWVDEFQAHKRKIDGISPATWERAYRAYFRGEKLNEATAIAAITRYPAASRDRLRATMAWTALAKFAGMSWDLSAYRGTYGLTKTQKLQIPTDDRLLAIAEDLRSRSRWFGWYALQLCYGLRTHEPQFASLFWDDELNVLLCRVTEGKTGGRIVYPLPAEWPAQLKLDEGYPMPDVSGATYREIGSRTDQAYKRLKIGFPPRTLRYAYVVRGIVRLGFSVPEVAGWCGHSPAVLLATYSRYINEQTARDSYRKRAIGNG